MREILAQEITIPIQILPLNKTKINQNLQFFGSTEERFKKKKVNKVVGPGSYEISQNINLPHENRILIESAPFSTTEK